MYSKFYKTYSITVAYILICQSTTNMILKETKEKATIFSNFS